MFKTLKFKSLFLFIALIGASGLFAQEQDINDSELNKFAEAYMNIQLQNQEAQTQMISIIENEGLKTDRYSEIENSTLDPNLKSDATEAEMKMYANATAKMEELRPGLEKKAIDGIVATGLTFERFQELAGAIQNDQSLQQRLQGILMANQKE